MFFPECSASALCFKYDKALLFGLRLLLQRGTPFLFSCELDFILKPIIRMTFLLTTLIFAIIDVK